jgi:IS5 family transposase
VFSYVSLEQRVPNATTGHPSIAPEKLLRAILLQALYGKRSERLLMEELDYSLLFRWFVGLAIDDAVWDATVFSKNRDRWIEGEIANRFFVAVRGQLEKSGLMSDEHFTVDGTSWRRGRIGGVSGIRQTRRSAAADMAGNGCCGIRMRAGWIRRPACTASASAGVPEPSYLRHVLTENDHRLIGAASVTEAGTRAERDALLALLDQRRSRERRSLGADKHYQERQFVEACGQRRTACGGVRTGQPAAE